MKQEREIQEAVSRIAGISPKNVICTEDRGVLFINVQTSMTMLEKHEAMKEAVVAIVGHSRVTIV